MMKKMILLIAGWCALLSAWADEPLRKPLTFVPSDSVVVWGEDRSDFRMTALSIAPELQASAVIVGEINHKLLKRQTKEWQKNILPAINSLGGIDDEDGKLQVLSTSEIVDASAGLFLQTADRQYMDMLERTALNALMSVATPGELTFDKRIAARALMKVSGMIYATDEEGIYVNLYVNSSTHVKNERWNFVMDQLTAMPHSGRVKLRISGLAKGQCPIKIRLRMPEWAYQGVFDKMNFKMSQTPQQLPVVYVNGREEFYQMEKGYLVISRKWNSGDEVFFDFPMKTELLMPAKAQSGHLLKVALQRGPLVYGYSRSTSGLSLSSENVITEDEEPNRYGHSVLNVSVRDEKGKKLILKAEPVMDGVPVYLINCAD